MDLMPIANAECVLPDKTDIRKRTEKNVGRLVAGLTEDHFEIVVHF